MIHTPFVHLLPEKVWAKMGEYEKKRTDVLVIRGVKKVYKHQEIKGNARIYKG